MSLLEVIMVGMDLYTCRRKCTVCTHKNEALHLPVHGEWVYLKCKRKKIQVSIKLAVRLGKYLLLLGIFLMAQQNILVCKKKKKKKRRKTKNAANTPLSFSFTSTVTSVTSNFLCFDPEDSVVI